MTIEYRLLPISRLEEVNDLLLANFFKQEPLGNRLGAQPDNDVRPWLSRVTEPLINQNMSCMAVEDDRVVGVALNRIVYREPEKNIDSFAEAIETNNEIFMRKILDFMDVLYEGVDFLSQFGEERMFVYNMIAVKGAFSGRGIATEMIRFSERLALEAGFRVLTSETTGIMSAKVFAKLGYERVKELEYNQYEAKSGGKIFANLDPHKSCVVWLKIIDKID